MTFQGMEAKGKWKDTCIESILPVTLQSGDDRRGVPEGADLRCDPASHAILQGRHRVCGFPIDKLCGMTYNPVNM